MLKVQSQISMCYLSSLNNKTDTWLSTTPIVRMLLYTAMIFPMYYTHLTDISTSVLEKCISFFVTNYKDSTDCYHIEQCPCDLAADV